MYKEDDKLDAPNAGGGRRWGGFTGGGIKYKNVKDKVALESTDFFEIVLPATSHTSTDNLE